MRDVFGKWYHFIGIGGAGMSGLAKILLASGIKVSGSDLVVSPVIHKLRENGAQVSIGHTPENLQPGVDKVVVSSAIPPLNVELRAARERGLDVISRGELLAQVMSLFKGIAVVGAHGKTTTSSMISLVLAQAGLDPTFIIGGEVNDIGGNAKLGKGEFLVAEADESDGSFLKLEPYVAVITNIDNDHLDYYKNIEEITRAFQKFLSRLKPEGFAVLCTDNALVGKLEPGGVEVITYGLQGTPDFKAGRVTQTGLKTEALVFQNRRKLGKLTLAVPGAHNIQNSLAAVAVGMRLGLSFSAIAEALATFRGAQRRFQMVAQCNGIRIIDDYAHHPTEIKALLQAAAGLHPRRTIVVFQPHRYTRTYFLKEEFGEAFQGSDLVIVTDIYPAGEKPLNGVNAGLVVEALKKNKQNVVYLGQLEAVEEFLLREYQTGDLILTVGAGNVWTVGQNFARLLKEGPRNKSRDSQRV
ncbi:MAG: UDP-N-acetylmuramate--L-alanine ligase [Bacillota bacterium]|nr:UDP-N-acetylmuramate--L-alanine ligase [Bacillota bacterium]